MPHLRTALKRTSVASSHLVYYCLLCLVVFVYQKVLYKSRLFSLLCVVTSFTKKNKTKQTHTFKKMNLTLNLCLHILYLSKTPFSTCLLSRRQRQPQSLQRQALNLEPNDRFILLAANSDLLQNLMLVSRSLWKQKQQMGPSDSPPDLSETPWVCLGRRGRKKERERVGVGGGRMQPLSPACQLA